MLMYRSHETSFLFRKLPCIQYTLFVFYKKNLIWLINSPSASKVCFTNSCTYCRIKLFEAVFQCFSLLSSLFKRYGRALSLTWILWKSKKKKCQKIEDENFELLNRRNSKNKSHIIGILALWDAQKCMVYWYIVWCVIEYLGI